MKSSTKFWLGAGTALAGVWAWFKFQPTTLARIQALELSRRPPPGYVSATNMFDANGRPGVRYLYQAGLTIGSQRFGTAMQFFVPSDPTQRGVLSPVELQRVPV